VRYLAPSRSERVAKWKKAAQNWIQVERIAPKLRDEIGGKNLD